MRGHIFLLAYNDDRNAKRTLPSQELVSLANYSWGWRSFLGLAKCLVQKYWKAGATAAFKAEMEKLEIGPNGKRDPVAINELKRKHKELTKSGQEVLGLDFATELNKMVNAYKIEYNEQRELYADSKGKVPEEQF